MKKYFNYFCVTSILVIGSIIAPFITQAHGGAPENEIESIDVLIRSWSFTSVVIAGIIAILFLGISFFDTQASELRKRFYFFVVIIPVVLVSLFIAGATMYLNIISETNGPVHWHADFKIFNCDQEVDLKDPRGLSNRIGTPVLHEHNDNRTHVEGTVADFHNVSLGHFFEVIGGSAESGRLVVPTDHGFEEMTNGSACVSHGRLWPAHLQVFVYRTEGSRAYQEKLDYHWPAYVLSPYQKVPPGDCIIFELDTQEKNKTEHICDWYKIGIQKGELHPTNF